MNQGPIIKGFYLRLETLKEILTTFKTTLKPPKMLISEVSRYNYKLCKTFQQVDILGLSLCLRLR